jgi:EAL domain-containing protein (putative c-di-GMP-specific phosphodiesterase class I)
VILNLLRKRGIHIALDDFGTGYASLMHLKQFPVDHIKIDRIFIKDLHRSPEDEAIVAAVNSLHLQVTAEGVETKEQEQHLRALGCYTAQGFLYSAAVSGAEVPGVLALAASRG